ncbi:MAG: ATP-binding protein [Proteobacteria bacterium]|nr:ATP-binding protein [Pseudomonadota bacterium]
MPLPVNLKLPAKLQHLEQLIDFVTNCAREQGITQNKIGEIQVAVEEALVNVINYAYKDEEGDVEVACMLDGEKFIIEIIDSGFPFDFLSLQDPDISLNVSERNIGGLGIYLIKRLMDHVEHKREDDKNILTLMVSTKQSKSEPDNVTKI